MFRHSLLLHFLILCDLGYDWDFILKDYKEYMNIIKEMESLKNEEQNWNKGLSQIKANHTFIKNVGTCSDQWIWWLSNDFYQMNSEADFEYVYTCFLSL